MVYEFIAKIKNIETAHTVEELSIIADDITPRLCPPFDIKFVLPDANKNGEVLVKAQLSISVMIQFHDKELETAITSFTDFLDTIAEALSGEVSKHEAFYNNSKTFSKLYS